MQLENRYIVLKLKDVDSVPKDLQKALTLIGEAVERARMERGAAFFDCLVIEKDWPEYEPALAMLSARVDGVSEAAEFTERQWADIPLDGKPEGRTARGLLTEALAALDADMAGMNVSLRRDIRDFLANFETFWPKDKMKPGKFEAAIHKACVEPFEAPTVVKHSHYKKDIRHLNMLDVYRVLQLFDVTDPAVQHAVKKLLVAGGRGAGKDRERDYREAVDSINRALQMIAEDDVDRSGMNFAGEVGGL